MLAVGSTVFQILFVLALAPFVNGIIKKTKAFFQSRRGPSVLQPYRDLYKYLHKETVFSEHSSWIFRATPYIYFVSVMAVALTLPVISTFGVFSFNGDLFLLIYLLAMARFFLALAGLDAGSAFGGMASSREMAISAIAEPALMLPLFTMSIVAGTSNLSGIVQHVASSGFPVLTSAHLMTFAALFVVGIAETGRIPVDNPDTHLELTMIHEGMLLEYSGKPLALLTLGAQIKQLLIFALLANIFFPWGIATTAAGFPLAGLLSGALTFALKAAALGVIMAVIETSMAKMRLFKVPDLLMGSFLLGLLGLISHILLRG